MKAERNKIEMILLFKFPLSIKNNGMIRKVNGESMITKLSTLKT